MFAILSFPAEGAERMHLVDMAYKADVSGVRFESMSDEQKLAYILGMRAGYYQGRREMARTVVDNLTMAAVGFKP